MKIIDEIGQTLLFFKSMLTSFAKKNLSRELLFEQIWKVTTQSSATTAMAGFFVGAIMTVQFTMQMKDFGALGYLGGLTTSATIREIGPLLIAFMLAGKVGAFTSAELGTMRVTEQIDAIRCLGADPMQEIILPRFIAIIISAFFLLGLGLLLSMFGGIAMGKIYSGVSPEEYVRHVPRIVSALSISIGLIKCFLFACVIALISTFRGYTTKGGAKGVGKAVVNTAVASMITIVIVDWFASAVGDILTKMVIGV